MDIIFDTKIGRIKVEEHLGYITSLDLTNYEVKASENKLLNEAKRQMLAYFEGMHTFDLPLNPKATPFQQKVYQALLKIPYGKTASYSEIAAMIGNPKASRAVGGAVNKNPIMIIIPCHRIIGKDGNLVGFYGGLALKEKLLKLEGIR